MRGYSDLVQFGLNEMDKSVGKSLLIPLALSAASISLWPLFRY
jgi:hypothetical protein